MRIRTTAVAAGAAVLLALTACGSSDDGDNTVEPTKALELGESTPSVDPSEALEDAGIPPVPKNANREELLDALRAIGPAVVGADEDQTINAAKDQCRAINSGGGNLDESAASRFAQGDMDITAEQGKAINAVLKASGFCKA